MITAKAGKTVRVVCNECLQTFDITLEPEVNTNRKVHAAKWDLQTIIKVCPFCSDDSISLIGEIK